MILARPVLVALAGLGVTGCVRYQPRPIDPAEYVSQYRTRRLDDSATVTWVARWSGAPAPEGWTDRQLAVAALRLRAELPRARAGWLAARAGEKSAGARPQPGVNADVERAVSGGRGEAPWVVGVGALLTFELGGKRAARVQEARARSVAAEAGLATEAWSIVSETRRAALDVVLAEAARGGAALELAAIAKVQALEQQGFAEAALSASEMSRTGAEVEEVRVSVAAAERARIDARAALAGAVGIPPRALDSVTVLPVTVTACENLETLGVDSLLEAAVKTRPEIARALAGYAGAEASLRLQIARQYPDLELGPGFIWDQGIHRWTLAFAVPALLAFRNRAPIVQAEAERSAAGARLVEVQDSVLREVGLAAERCRGARLEQQAADSQVVAAGRNLARARAAYARGETARLDAALAELAVVRADRVRRTAAQTAMLVSLDLETAVGQWHGRDGSGWPDPRVESGEEGVSK